MLKGLLLATVLAASVWNAAAAESPKECSAQSPCEEISRRHRVSGEKMSAQKVKCTITPQDCQKHLGEYVSVKFLVDNTHACHKGHVYLNESTDYKTCFAAIISSAARKLFPADADVAYKGKTVLVTGTLEMFGGTPKIVLDKPEQIALLK